MKFGIPTEVPGSRNDANAGQERRGTFLDAEGDPAAADCIGFVLDGKPIIQRRSSFVASHQQAVYGFHHLPPNPLWCIQECAADEA